MKYKYDAATVFGGKLAEGVNNVITGREEIRRVKAAALVAVSTNGGPNFANLEGGDFGAAAGQGEAWYNTLSSTLTSLDAIPQAFLEAIDMGG